ncbi:MAG: hypothetical protein JWO67_5383, partial [Streptosporangiaceae bacterium]|nr:hypothetical protein [Streptosporangiaceae bacterium]
VALLAFIAGSAAGAYSARWAVLGLLVIVAFLALLAIGITKLVLIVADHHRRSEPS